MWYHLSKTKRTQDYIETIPSPGPKRSNDEIRPDASSVAPTVVQCYVAVPEHPDKVDRLYIYELEVDDPLPLTAENRVWDYEITQEHLITWELLRERGGRIAVRYVGYVAFTSERLMLLKNELRDGVTFTAREENAYLWEVIGEEWTARFDARGEIRTLLGGGSVSVQRPALLGPARE